MKNLLNLGKALNKNEQKAINGGNSNMNTNNCLNTGSQCIQDDDCDDSFSFTDFECQNGYCRPS